jgi:hypothetical protein
LAKTRCVGRAARNRFRVSPTQFTHLRSGNVFVRASGALGAHTSIGSRETHITLARHTPCCRKRVGSTIEAIGLPGLVVVFSSLTGKAYLINPVLASWAHQDQITQHTVHRICLVASLTCTRDIACASCKRRRQISTRHTLSGPQLFLVRASAAGDTGSIDSSSVAGVAQAISLLAARVHVNRTILALLRHPVKNLFGRALPTHECQDIFSSIHAVPNACHLRRRENIVDCIHARHHAVEMIITKYGICSVQGPSQICESKISACSGGATCNTLPGTIYINGQLVQF